MTLNKKKRTDILHIPLAPAVAVVAVDNRDMAADDAVADMKDVAASAAVADNDSVRILAAEALRSLRYCLLHHPDIVDLGNMTFPLLFPTSLFGSR